MKTFLKQCFPKEELQIEKLSGDGGHRCYHRIHKKNGSSYILMFSGEKDKSLQDFLLIHKQLKKAGCLLPETFQQDWEKGFLLLEDLGDLSLEQLHLQKGWAHSKAFYQKALEQMLALQKITLKDKKFDKAFFLKELDFSFFHLEKILNHPLKLHQKKALAFKELKDILCKIDQAPFAYCHRDFHSKNMMVFKKDLYLLDFQDAGQGPFLYDLVSLLYDSYVFLEEQQKEELIKFYFIKSSTTFKTYCKNENFFYHLLQLQFLQRGLKACACFASFYNEKQKKTHLPYLVPTFKNLIKLAKMHSYLGLQNYFESFLNLWQKKSVTI